jgi:glycosyltransferase involved in cell wall biosynthesis
VRILIVNDYGTPSGGAELQSVRIRDLLRERGHDAMLFTSDARPVPIAPLSDFLCFGARGRIGRVTQVANPWAAAALRRAIASFRPDVVHVRMFLSQLSPLVLPRLRDTATVLHVVNYQLICPLNTKILPDGATCTQPAGAICRRSGCVSSLGRARFALQRAMWERWHDAIDVVVANSRWTAARLTADGVPVTDTLTYGVPARGPRPPLAARPTIAFVGRLFQKKGVDVLLHAMALIRSSIPDATLRIVGEGPERAALEALVRALALDDVVELLGFVPSHEVAAAVSDAWVQVVPSVWEEPFGMVTIEAMMRGTAVIASATGGPSEVVRDGETGLLVPPADAPALAGALATLLRDRELARRMGERGYAIARESFSEDAMMDRATRVYEVARARFRAARG